jgi:thiol:disulfide interchange protein DsbD
VAVPLVALVLAAPALAQSKKDRANHIRFEVALAPATDPFAAENRADGKKVEFQRGQTLLLTLRGTPQPGWYTYPAVKLLPGQQEAQRSRILPGKGLVPVGPIRESEPKTAEEKDIGRYNKFDGPFTWQQEVLLRPDLPGGETVEVPLTINLQACEKTCILEKYDLTVPVPVSSAPALTLTAEQEKFIREHDARLARGADSTDTPSPGEFDWRELVVVDRPGAVNVTGKSSGLLALLVTAVIGGLISLATPCVFPMIPITVSIFIKQGETGKGNVLLKASVYCLTLVVVLTIGGIALGSFLQTISQHWVTNIVLTAVFIFFGLSLLGMYDITLPSWLSDATASGEGKGGLLGIAFMALTFSIISFACVGPIYGGFTALSASSGSAVEGWTQRILAPLAFSLAFASPFFVLALFPSLLKAMPRSGSWMNTVKVTMGFLELAAAFKFVRAAELNLLAKSEYFTFDLVLGIYVVLAVAAALYLFGFYKLPHDHETPESISVTRLAFALIFLSLAVYFVPGVFKDDKGRSQKPRGVVFEWTRSFLLPDDPSNWSADLQKALADAERENKPLFIDFTGLG